MTALPTLELLVREADGRTLLCAPEVGLYTLAAESGHVLVPGQQAGVLVTLGRARSLRVPAGVSGVVRSLPPERVHHPVGYGDTLIELAPLEGGGPGLAPAAAAAQGASGALLLRSESAGRFWHRASPSEPALVQSGDLLEEGTAIGLIEVMKTFAQVVYHARDGLPARARVLRVAVGDGADVSPGDALLELEPA